MKKIIYILILTTIIVNAWAIQTHRAINRTALTRSTAPAVKCLSDSKQQNKPHVTHKTLY